LAIWLFLFVVLRGGGLAEGDDCDEAVEDWLALTLTLTLTGLGAPEDLLLLGVLVEAATCCFLLAAGFVAVGEDVLAAGFLEKKENKVPCLRLLLAFALLDDMLTSIYMPQRPFAMGSETAGRILIGLVENCCCG
jgi:hypothetical protein